MSEINPITAGPVGRVSSISTSSGRDAHVAEDATVRRGTDRVEVSQMALYLNKLKDLPVRQDLVDTVRQQISEGTYDTPDKVDAAIGEILKDG